MNDLETTLPGTIRNGISVKRRPALTILEKQHFELSKFLNSPFFQKNNNVIRKLVVPSSFSTNWVWLAPKVYYAYVLK
jgi:hypothetical protein